MLYARCKRLYQIYKKRLLKNYTFGFIRLRNERIKKEKAKELIKLYEGKKPATLNIFLDYVGLDEHQFNEIVASHIVKPNNHDFKNNDNSIKNPDHDDYDTSGAMDKKYAQEKFKEWFTD